MDINFKILNIIFYQLYHAKYISIKFKRFKYKIRTIYKNLKDVYQKYNVFMINKNLNLIKILNEIKFEKYLKLFF
jgi:hypothetical protein